MSKKVVFLDFDGVLNSTAFIKEIGDAWTADQIDPSAVVHLNTIIVATKADVVISSTWRLLHPFAKLKSILLDAGFKGRVVGMTPNLSHKPIQSQIYRSVERGHEIAAWLHEQDTKPKSIAIIDDDDDMAHLKPCLVQTDFNDGLLEKHVPSVLELLDKPWITLLRN